MEKKSVESQCVAGNHIQLRKTLSWKLLRAQQAIGGRIVCAFLILFPKHLLIAPAGDKILD